MSRRRDADLSGEALSDSDVLRVSGLVKGFQTKAGRLMAVNDVNFTLGRGETLGIVGESGCGKTTLARLLLRLERPDSGSALLRGGEDFFALSGDRLRQARRRIQMVFQDPHSSLNPRMTAAAAIAEPWLNYPDVVPVKERAQQVESLLGMVGMTQRSAGRYPHELSGGQLQRVGIARALALSPELLVLDEPVASLDLSVQAKVLNVLSDLQAELGVSYLFIAHDLSVMRHVAHRIGVIYLGRIVEIGTAEQIFKQPEHPYTRGLLAASPILDLTRKSRRSHAVLQGDPPSPVTPPSGCPFHTRCEFAQDRCAEERPELQERMGDAGHQTACHFVPLITGRTAAAPAETPRVSSARQKT
jgi:oligopeptide transport system ATP-binding protein